MSEEERVEYDYMEKMNNLLDQVGETKASTEKLLKSRDLIHEIAENAKKTGMFEMAKDTYEEFLEWMREEEDKSTRVEYAWLHFLDRAASAPTQVHLRGAVLLCIPVLDVMLEEYAAGKDPV